MIIAFTGAGISAASGIPTFGEQPGIRGKLTRTYANSNPIGFQETIESMRQVIEKAEPNDAHYAIAEYDIPVITMNIDGMHEKAGSKHVMAIHGEIQTNDVVLYGDQAPRYCDAIDWAWAMQPGDIMMIVGTSFYTGISEMIRDYAKKSGAMIKIINEDAEHEVRAFIERYQNRIEPFEVFEQRVNEIYS